MNAVLEELTSGLRRMYPTKTECQKEALDPTEKAELTRAVCKGADFFLVILRRLRSEVPWYRRILEVGEKLEIGTSSQYDIVHVVLGRDLTSLVADTNFPSNRGDSEGSGDLIDLILLPGFFYDHGFDVRNYGVPDASVGKQFLKDEWLRRARRMVPH